MIRKNMENANGARKAGMGKRRDGGVGRDLLEHVLKTLLELACEREREAR
jgi:hypothetical protein